MQRVVLFDQFQATLNVVLFMSLPPLIGAMVVGLVVGLLQAVTQVQDQSLPMVFKLIVIMLILVLGGPLLAAPLVQLAKYQFDTFATTTR